VNKYLILFYCGS